MGGRDGGMLIKFYMYHHRTDEEKFREGTSTVCTVLSILKKLATVFPPKYKGEHSYSVQFSSIYCFGLGLGYTKTRHSQ